MACKIWILVCIMILGAILDAPNDLAKGALTMTGDIRELMEGIEKGTHLRGSYHRYAEDTGREIIYTGLSVDISGGKTYQSNDVQATEAFFEAVNFEGSAVVSTRSEYESVGYWSC